MTTAMDNQSYLSSFYEAFEQETVPRQVFSCDDFTRLQLNQTFLTDYDDQNSVLNVYHQFIMPSDSSNSLMSLATSESNLQELRTSCEKQKLLALPTQLFQMVEDFNYPSLVDTSYSTHDKTSLKFPSIFIVNAFMESLADFLKQFPENEDMATSTVA